MVTGCNQAKTIIFIRVFTAKSIQSCDVPSVGRDHVVHSTVFIVKQ